MSPLKEKKFLHALLLAGAGYDSTQKLYEKFGSYDAAWHAGETALKHAGLTKERTALITQKKRDIDPDAEIKKLAAEGIVLMTADEAGFPPELAEIPAPPRWLYIKGSIPEHTPRLAVVGTRRPTGYGREATHKIIGELSEQAELVIVSGLAQGIDAEAHRAALEYGLKTIAVLGSGMDRDSLFPPEHWNLAEEMVKKGGAVVSEYPPGTPAFKAHFPQRNRIISGLSLGVLVVEAREKSGALITARLALDQNREVFAIPGPIFAFPSRGPHGLIQQGAKLVGDGGDILDELGITHARTPRRDVPLNEKERALLDMLEEPLTLDAIKEKTRFDTAVIVASLSMLELQGRVKQMGGDTYQRIDT